jgi:peptidoglycan/xylan/chitin deacetylase (PgdA/CDA1 family)
MRLRATRKNIIITIVLIAALAAILYARAQYVVPIIMYHRIDENSAVSTLSVSPESFEAQMRFLKNQHYNVVGLEDLVGMVKKNSFPPKTIAITFDDGYEDNYLKAYPVLKELGLQATIFIIPAMVGTDGYLTWDQVLEMSESGIIIIGSHSFTHPWLTNQPDQKLDSEIIDSKRAIESHLGKDIGAFCYPLGRFNENVREKVINAGYKIAVATNPGKKYPKHDLYAMKRIKIARSSDNLFVFWLETSGFYTWIKEHRGKHFLAE